MVSVIVPNYNHAPYLRQRIDSILAQTYQDFELILLDDCSTDGSREILQSYAGNPHVTHVVLNEWNSGSTFHQWEKGFSLAKGVFIWIAESDDVAEPDLLKECMERLEADEAVQLAYTYSYYIDQDGRRMKTSIDEPEKYSGNGIYDAQWFRSHRMVYKNIIYNASMVVFRKSALTHVTPDFKTFTYCGDWCFWFDMMSEGKVAEVPRKLNNFRQHLGKVSKKANLEGRDFKENAKCQQRMADLLGLTAYQRRCLRGRLTKRIRKANFPNKQAVIAAYPDLYAGTFWDVLLYEVDKYTKWSGLLT